MKLSSYLPWRRVMATWTEDGIVKSESPIAVWQAAFVISLLHLLCFFEGIKGKAHFAPNPVDKPHAQP